MYYIYYIYLPPGVLFYLANIVGSALNVVACTEGILSNFGPKGIILQVFFNDWSENKMLPAHIQILPGGFWWEVLYSTMINIVNLVLCLIGAGLFGKACLLILISGK